MCFVNVRASTIFNITSLLRQNEERLELKHILANCTAGTVLLLTTGRDLEAKKLLKYFYLILKLDSSLLLISEDGIIG